MTITRKRVKKKETANPKEEWMKQKFPVFLVLVVLTVALAVMGTYVAGNPAAQKGQVVKMANCYAIPTAAQQPQPIAVAVATTRPVAAQYNYNVDTEDVIAKRKTFTDARNLIL